MRLVLACAAMAFMLNGCALWGFALVTPATVDGATQVNATHGGEFSKSAWDEACWAAGGTVVPQNGTHGPHNCVM